jgi:hypothetical protein
VLELQLLHWVTIHCSVTARSLASQAEQRPRTPPLSLIVRECLFPIIRQECQIPHWGEEHCNLVFASGRRRSVSPRYTEAQHFTMLLPSGDSHLSCPRAEILDFPLSAISYTAGAKRPPSTSAQRHHAPHLDCSRVPVPQSKNGNYSLKTEGEKR